MLSSSRLTLAVNVITLIPPLNNLRVLPDDFNVVNISSDKVGNTGSVWG